MLLVQMILKARAKPHYLKVLVCELRLRRGIVHFHSRLKPVAMGIESIAKTIGPAKSMSFGHGRIAPVFLFWTIGCWHAGMTY